jgi:hypothetical protein
MVIDAARGLVVRRLHMAAIQRGVASSSPQDKGGGAVANVEDIKLGTEDPAGYEITCIYALNPPEYAVYGTRIRVAIEYADDQEAARQQRSALAGCSPLRGQINGLIGGWRGDGKGARPRRATDYDRRVADALVVGLEGGVLAAVDLLAEIRNDIVAERRSIAQSDYLLTAVLTVIALLAIAATVAVFGHFPTEAATSASPVPGDPAIATPSPAQTAWAAITGSFGGTLGAFFSIAVGFRRRTVLVDLQKWDNRRDAILRVVVGTMGGAILICLILTDLISVLKIESSTLTAGAGVGPLTALVFGFLAGFSERAVPDILAKASLATDAATGEGSSDVATEQARAGAVGAVVPGAPAAAPAPVVVVAVDPAAEGSGPKNGSGSGPPPLVEADETADAADLPPRHAANTP